jgi:hypothetical protein
LREDLAKRIFDARHRYNLGLADPLDDSCDPDGWLHRQLGEHYKEIISEIKNHANIHLIEEKHVVGLRGASLRGRSDEMMQERYVMFMEYTERGDLYTLIECWKDAAKNVPEVFIWLLLKCLVSACLAMEELGLVHHDIKV